MGCESSVLISMTSPRLAALGTRTRGSAIHTPLIAPHFFDAGAKSHEDARRPRPHRAVAHLRQGEHGLGAGQAKTRANLRFASPRSEMIGGSDWFWIPFDKDMQTQHMIVRGHWTVDRHRQWHRIACLRDLG